MVPTEVALSLAGGIPYGKHMCGVEEDEPGPYQSLGPPLLNPAQLISKWQGLALPNYVA